ncbi:hypothetical protein [Streptomyces radicis]|uniref:Uncharacterized protein n=1 Tax=Streptomyces radicis TaxID=1750517 RepID=A0A3A9WI45_9ACTN|nr:hypothetical protein [Streptomyces radicis]RKN11983.1 hypothetical protein D7319_03495 [Streptomyces radicis]RKN25966.1 hypothetical protein D7318_06985 [Streptomyces radicis]
MRIRSVLTASAMAAAIIVGGAGGALAYKGDDTADPSAGAAEFGTCGIYAGVIEDNPVFGSGCAGGRLAWK